MLGVSSIEEIILESVPLTTVYSEGASGHCELSHFNTIKQFEGGGENGGDDGGGTDGGFGGEDGGGDNGGLDGGVKGGAYGGEGGVDGGREGRGREGGEEGGGDVGGGGMGCVKPKNSNIHSGHCIFVGREVLKGLQLLHPICDGSQLFPIGANSSVRLSH
jgi:hypothetical protein